MATSAWAAAGAAARMLHDAPLPPWAGRSPGEIASQLDGECEWLVANGVLPADLVTRNRQVAEAALWPWTPVFIHGYGTDADLERLHEPDGYECRPAASSGSISPSASSSGLAAAAARRAEPHPRLTSASNRQVQISVS